MDKNKQGAVPRHVAIIMDGNNRWAKRRLLPGVAGHKAGVDAVRAVIEVCAESGVEVLTLFAFSSENWQRPAEEVGALMEDALAKAREVLPAGMTVRVSGYGEVLVATTDAVVWGQVSSILSSPALIVLMGSLVFFLAEIWLTTLHLDEA